MKIKILCETCKYGKKLGFNFDLVKDELVVWNYYCHSHKITMSNTVVVCEDYKEIKNEISNKNYRKSKL